MIIKHKIILEENEEVLYVYLDNDPVEFAKNYRNLLEGEKRTSLMGQINSYIKKKNVKYRGNIVKVLAGSMVVATLFFTPAPINNVKAKPISKTSTSSYTIQAGDTLSEIAIRYDLSVQELKNLNNLSSDTIYIGQELNVTKANSLTYKVVTGDTLSEIAQRYNLTTQELKTLNNLTTDTIYVGQTLRVGAEVQTSSYQVVSGDTLSEIAQKYNMTTEELKSLNNLTTDTIYVGQTLQIKQTQTTTPLTYTVKAGDSLWDIANKYNTTVDNLRKINNLTTDTLQIGQILVLNDATDPTEQTTYIVKAGDSLWDIANRYNTSVESLRVINNLTTDTLQIGQILVIDDETYPPEQTTYTVQIGDSLWGIASMYNTSVDNLRTLNNLVGDNIYPGQILVVSGNLVAPEEDITVTVRRYNGVVENIPLEEYVVGVVSGELPQYFNEEAFKAQALAARTYAMSRIDNGEILSDSDSHQVYRDKYQLQQLWGNNFDEYYTKISNAVSHTRGQVITYNGEYIDALFFSTSNGRTEDPVNVWGGELSYLKSVDSSWDVQSPEYYDVKMMSYNEFSDRLGITNANNLYANELTRTAGDGVGTIEISGRTFTGEYVRRNLGLRSTDYDISFSNGEVRIVQRGWGHRVGMSQYGANYMGQYGYSYQQIIHHYYQGVDIITL